MATSKEVARAKSKTPVEARAAARKVSATKSSLKPTKDQLAQTHDYKHGHKAVQRPDVGVQDQFSAKKPPKTYRYDSSLDPSLSWDENRDRELAEWLLGLVSRCATEGEDVVFKKPQDWAGGGIRVESLKMAADLLQKISKPALNWAGKAERHQIEIPTVPLFVHERHSTKA
jgi:adenine-specific DNA-methyltransferase